MNVAMESALIHLQEHKGYKGKTVLSSASFVSFVANRRWRWLGASLEVVREACFGLYHHRFRAALSWGETAPLANLIIQQENSQRGESLFHSAEQLLHPFYIVPDCFFCRGEPCRKMLGKTCGNTLDMFDQLLSCR